MRKIADEIIEGLQEGLAHARGTKVRGLRVHHIEVPKVDPRTIRTKLRLTQAQMAEYLGTSTSGYRKWEQGHRDPGGAARTLLRVMEREPRSRPPCTDRVSEPIELHPYDPAWPAAFEAERLLVAPLFPSPPALIEHMGSTSIPGLAAKSVIDIIVLVEDLETARQAIPALEATGYSFWADNPDKTKLYLVKGLPPAPKRTHHLHVYDYEPEVRRHLIFRDHLRANPEALAAYLALKRDLADRFRDDREAYSKQKTGFIDELVMSLGGPPRRVAWDP